MALGQGLVSSELIIIKKNTYQLLFNYTIVHLKIYMIVDFSWRQILKAKYILSLFIYIYKIPEQFAPPIICFNSDETETSGFLFIVLTLVYTE